MKLLKFTNGDDVFEDFNTAYKRHDKGYIILAPPGTGKSHFVNSQKGTKKDWIDVDILFGEKSLNINWNNCKNRDDLRLAYLRADYMLEHCKVYGYRIIGALFWEYKADAMVIIPLKQHIKYMKNRSDLDLKKLKNLRNIFISHAKEKKIPIFKSINEAIRYINSLNNK